MALGTLEMFLIPFHMHVLHDLSQETFLPNMLCECLLMTSRVTFEQTRNGSRLVSILKFRSAI